ncbi:hypothetical protein ABXN37_08925 [Piscinibacter sakaiensis]|uniref:Putative nucleotidyltransferase n=1 Tax=Piscinibacter sakaiensis TaxID=1547922 RepID=A0A0K8NZB8_PISS1|nr:hypothetical protein [Piscinibacter sakaiensis]GAP35270.1 putative nucleotidyltransferase [Piscinibacter sakaiensis]
MSRTRAEIAAAAARLVVEEGLEYGAAKRRAARDLGLGVRAGELPSNEVVEDEVRAYLALYCADTQPAELAALREVAAHWMERLAPFRPHLGGAVWRGTATRLSAVQLALYCDDPKATEIALINRGIDFDVGSLPNGRGGEPLEVLTLAHRSAALGEPVSVHLVLHDLDDLRGALKPDAGGRSLRGDLPALRRLMMEH